jgi:hypothetical protein
MVGFMKNGIINISFMLFGIIIIFVLTYMYVLYFQVGSISKNIKSELYYILMECKLELSKDDLAYANFKMDKSKIETRIYKWAENTRKSQINVKNIEIEELLTNIMQDRVTLKVKLKITFSPVIKIRDKLSFYIKDEIVLKLLKYK